MKYLHGAIGLICIMMFSCQPKPTALITYELERKDFSERIFGTGTLRSANNTVITTPRLASNSIKVIQLLEEGTTVEPGDTVCILEATDITKHFDNSIEECDKLKADLIKLEASNAFNLAQLNAKLEEFKAQRRLSSLDSIQMKFTSPVKSQIKALEEKKNEIQQKKIIRKMKDNGKINEQSARAIQSQIIQKEQVVEQYREQLDQLQITAPTKGLLVYSSSPIYMILSSSGESSSSGGKLKIGSTVRMRMPLIELPDLDSMQLVLMLQEAEYKRIQKGQSVIIKPESLPGGQTTGTVKSKSLASQPLAYRFKVKSYKVVIDIDSLDNIFLPGLSANCEVIVQSVKDTIVAPSIAIFESDSMKYVYLEKDGLFKKQEVETGTSNPSETIISKGLQGNETISLLEPPLKLIRKQD
ncbi:MAG: hypothetical protein HOC82_12915 [Bacteroidetes bacterium]|nr:hypothetical protein [Bacteroidota bacterium]